MMRCEDKTKRKTEMVPVKFELKLIQSIEARAAEEKTNRSELIRRASEYYLSLIKCPYCGALNDKKAACCSVCTTEISQAYKAYGYLTRALDQVKSLHRENKAAIREMLILIRQNYQVLEDTELVQYFWDKYFNAIPVYYEEHPENYLEDKTLSKGMKDGLLYLDIMWKVIEEQAILYKCIMYKKGSKEEIMPDADKLKRIKNLMDIAEALVRIGLKDSARMHKAYDYSEPVPADFDKVMKAEVAVDEDAYKLDIFREMKEEFSGEWEKIGYMQQMIAALHGEKCEPAFFVEKIDGKITNAYRRTGRIKKSEK